MNQALTWLLALTALYCAYCVLWGVSSARLGKGPADFLLVGGQLPAWVFGIFATGASFGAWALVGFPSLVMRDGLQFGQLALLAVTVPLTGVLFFKRQWLLSKRHGYVTSGEMLSDYFGGDALRILVVGIALFSAIPYVGLQLSLSGSLMQWLSNGVLPAPFAMWVLTLVVMLYLCLGGLRGAAYVGSLQGLLLCAAMLGLGMLALGHLGGVQAFGTCMEFLSKLGGTAVGDWGNSAQNYNSYLSLPGVVQFTAGIGKENPVAGIWTSAMVLSTCFAFMGIQASPAFSMLAFSCRDAKAFGPQLVWISGAGMGILLLFFGVVSGLGADFLGASAAINVAGLTSLTTLPVLAPGQEGQLYANYLLTLADTSPWFMALLGVCALASIHVMVALFVTTTGTVIVRDVFMRYMTPLADAKQQKFYARCCIAAVTGCALLLATFAPNAQIQLGALALGLSVQLIPALAGVCWLPWITRDGASVGLVAGAFAVLMTEPLGGTICRLLGFELPWGRWPWTIHSAGWGIMVNIVFCVVVSWISNYKVELAQRQKYHRIFTEAAAMPKNQRFLRPVAWSFTLIWFFFAVGPGAVLGNDLFGAPNAGLAEWIGGIPSLWLWQLVWWALGVMVLWLLAYPMRMASRPSFEQMEVIVHESPG